MQGAPRMGRWEERRRVEKPPVTGDYAHPSFSSTLLDSIYRSIDDEKPSKTSRGAPDPSRKKKQTEWVPPAAVTRPRSHLRSTAAAATTSSSSDNSSYGGFSSSEAESVGARHPNRLKPIRTTDKIRPARSPLPPPPPTLPLPPPERKNRKEKVKKNLSSIRSKLRSPTSPAARLAGFLNSLFTAHHKPRPGGAGAACSGEESACSTASSFSRSSCMAAKKMTSAVERSVTFRLPVDAGGRKAREEGRCCRKAPATEKKVVMTWRGFAEEEEEDDDDVASESSSDLFELENLSVVGRYRDELPVYESTNPGRLLL
ncbi:putative basic proline-rich protein-like [Iris pallida]|uniref:Basic proline-rich protein-like n=1 Tax=Iris pallida TaxID=29817 RepID=A0AAX6EWB7_IRIPA|nr:putative basic proline-rich protein-like [Iris pallida]KAJ6808169.1 putative basic proline-rich protein-like [Iris pallida]